MNRVLSELIVDRARASALLFVAVLAAGLLPIAALPASARPVRPPFVVTSTGDAADANLADTACDADAATGGNQCKLRAAIQEANDTFGADRIHFNIPGDGVWTIAPTSALPPIIGTVTIDGYTQPGTSPNSAAFGTDALLLIQLNGEQTPAGTSGLDLRAANSTIKGLAIDRFPRGAIEIFGGEGNRVEGCFLGTGPGGTQDLGNGTGVLVVKGIGTVIGGGTPEARNLIAGNDLGVALVNPGTQGTKVEGNLIGVQKDGTSPLGNRFDGISIGFRASGTTIGGALANTVAFSGDHGVSVFNDATGISIQRNRIFANGRLGIDLEGGTETPSGATVNDLGAQDAGANNLQNKPLLKTASATTVHGRLNSTPNTSFVLRFFANPAGENEGKRFVGQKSVTTGTDGNATFTATIAAVAAGQNVTATATDPNGNTSEFSAPKVVA